MMLVLESDTESFFRAVLFESGPYSRAVLSTSVLSVFIQSSVGIVEECCAFPLSKPSLASAVCHMISSSSASQTPANDKWSKTKQILTHRSELLGDSWEYIGFLCSGGWFDSTHTNTITTYDTPLYSTI